MLSVEAVSTSHHSTSQRLSAFHREIVLASVQRFTGTYNPKYLRYCIAIAILPISVRRNFLVVRFKYQPTKS